jgi:hypothetical protein
MELRLFITAISGIENIAFHSLSAGKSQPHFGKSSSSSSRLVELCKSFIADKLWNFVGEPTTTTELPEGFLCRYRLTTLQPKKSCSSNHPTHGVAK